MFGVVDLEALPAEVSLAEPDDCRAFHVTVHGYGSVTGQVHAPPVDDALRSSATGWLDGEGSAFVLVERVRALAAGRTGDDWDARFTAMLGHARDKGWLSNDGEAIRAHLEWR